ncbi:MAG: hypothetical protein IPK70_16670 [Flavobacteriales bacterium]|jgi:hypothetical protein|nr:hypothetical protein [Flavobacteriales bacterium]
MRKLKKSRWVLASLAMLLLLATSGLTVSRMSCLISGHSVLSLGLADDCCPEEEHGGGSVIGATCCELVQASADRVELLPSATFDLVALPVTVAAPTWDAIALERRTLRWLDSRPPPLMGPERLALISMFLI